jgi:hypothetical protein
MLSFRGLPNTRAASDRVSLTGAAVEEVVGDVLQPAHFFVGPGKHLEVEFRAEDTIPWEILRGRLLDSAHATEQRTFAAWNVHVHEDVRRADEPLLSIKLDRQAHRIHVCRSILCYGWEGYHAGDNVYMSREKQKWVRELVGTIRLDLMADPEELRDELMGELFRAVVGTSRLPLTSAEAPLPAFSFGEFAFFYRSDAGSLRNADVPMRSWPELVTAALQPDLSWLETAKLLETLLRAAPLEDLQRATRLFAERWREVEHGHLEIPALLRTLFNEVSLSPGTGLPERVLVFLSYLEEGRFLDSAAVVDFLSYLLRQIGRHLTAYDLVTFHHRGANYPDALLLDVVLKDYFGRLERRPTLFLDAPDDIATEAQRKRLRRRALRQGCLLRSRYEGHRVPDAPTSQGENARVLPASHLRVGEEQILNPSRRRKQLFAGDPLGARLGETTRAILHASVADLQDLSELRELGLALFLDRPLGVAKHPTEPDQTTLFSYEAFSRSLAEGRLDYLTDTLHWIEPAEQERLRRRLHADVFVPGIPLVVLPPTNRPSPVALEDAHKVAGDFVLLRTTSRTVTDFFAQYDFRPVWSRFRLEAVGPSRHLLVLRTGPAVGILTVYDVEGRPRLELAIKGAHGYDSRGGVEFPVDGLSVLRVWEDTDDPARPREHDLRAEPVAVRPWLPLETR